MNLNSLENKTIETATLSERKAAIDSMRTFGILFQAGNKFDNETINLVMHIARFAGYTRVNWERLGLRFGLGVAFDEADFEAKLRAANAARK